MLPLLERDDDLPRDALRFARAFGVRLHHPDDLNLGLVPGVHGDSAVLASVDDERSDRGDREVSRLAELLVVASIVPSAVVHETLGRTRLGERGSGKAHGESNRE